MRYFACFNFYALCPNLPLVSKKKLANKCCPVA